MLKDAVSEFVRLKPRTRVLGKVSEIFQSHCTVEGLSNFVRVGECVAIGSENVKSRAQVVRITKTSALVKCLDSNASLWLGAPVERLGPIDIAPEYSWIGRVLNALGEPADDKGPILHGQTIYSIDRQPPNALHRARVEIPVLTGVKAIDAFTPLCRGQRVGVFAGSGVGKSTLLAMMARSPGFDVAIICLVGERGREVRDFLDETRLLTKERSVTVVATGDESPTMRRLAPLTAMTIAEWFRDHGAHVLLVIDSVTRYAHALREVAMAAGEPPVVHGYTPSVFADLPRLLERAGPGATEDGSITGVFSVLVDADNHNDPIADNIRGTLDGHIVLDREIAEQGRFPAVNILKSISRLADRAWNREQRALIEQIRSLISRYEETRDLRLLGGYQPGADPLLDRAIAVAPMLYENLRQSPEEQPSQNAIAGLASVLQSIKT